MDQKRMRHRRLPEPVLRVVTTIHSMSCEATYRRMVSLCKRADMSDETLMGFVTEAYPIIALVRPQL